MIGHVSKKRRRTDSKSNPLQTKSLQKASGVIGPRVREVGGEKFAIVCVDPVLHMSLDHHTVRSPVFEHFATYEVDLAFGDNEFPTRIELFRNTSEPNGYRAHVWQLETYRIQSTFPQDESTGEPLDHPSDDGLLIERSPLAKPDLLSFRAASDEDAREHVVSALHQFLDHGFGSTPNADDTGT